MTSPNDSQTPPEGSLNLDHVAHFVPNRDACRLALLQLGFAPTPFSLQHHRAAPDAALAPVGTGNHCVMLREGYLEFLVPLAATSVAGQLRAAIARYVGAHSIVFGTSGAAADYERLRACGFAPAPVIDLQRTVETPQGDATARFTVVRVPPGTMAEGRIQFCQHHTAELVWQRRWLDHPNGAVALEAVYVCVENLDATAQRYAGFLGLQPRAESGIRAFDLHRGRLELYDPVAFSARFRLEAPALPWIAGCELRSQDLGATRAVCARNLVPVREIGGGRVMVEAPAAVGGVFVFTDVRA